MNGIYKTVRKTEKCEGLGVGHLLCCATEAASPGLAAVNKNLPLRMQPAFGPRGLAQEAFIQLSGCSALPSHFLYSFPPFPKTTPESLVASQENTHLDSPRRPGFVLNYRGPTRNFVLDDSGEHCLQMEEKVRRGGPWATGG